MQYIRKRADFADAPVGQCLALGKELARFPFARRNGTTHLTKHGRQGDQILASRIVQIASDPASLFVLQTQKLPGDAPELLFGALAVFNIGVCPVPPYDLTTRPSESRSGIPRDRNQRYVPPTLRWRSSCS